MAAGEDSDKLGSITKSFDQYEYVAVIIPGALLLFGLLLAFPKHFPWTFDKDVSVGTLGLFLIAAFIVGQVLRALGDLVEYVLWLPCGGQPTEWVLHATRLIDDGQRTQLAAKLKTLLGDDKFEFAQYDKSRAKWQAVTRRIYAKVSAAKLAGRIDVFNRTYGLMIGLTVALGILAAIFLARGLCGPTLSRTDAALFATALVLAILTLTRFYRFGIFYGRELFVQFLALP